MSPQRILILMSNTGGGHRASARALEAGFEQFTPGRFAVEIVDLLHDYTFFPLNRAPELYPLLVTHAPALWRLLYATERVPGVARAAMDGIVARLAAPGVRRALAEHRPDLVISVHPLVQQMTAAALAEPGRRVPFVTVVTDLASAHPFWFDARVDACYVASEAAEAQARAAGLRPEQVHAFGLPVRPAFAHAYPPRPELRARLDMDAELPAVLVVGGGDGVGRVEEFAHALDAALAQAGGPCGQLVVIAGRNEALRAALAAHAWRVPARINGFVDNMPEWMLACDCIVTKAGPGTIAEATICGLPVVLSGFIPGQEAGNVPYVVDQGIGVFVPEPEAAAAAVARWFGPGRAAMQKAAANSRELGRPNSTALIVDSIARLLQ
jgi:1,2-diacylglycerol 3-beta-galactosyltransferase